LSKLVYEYETILDIISKIRTTLCENQSNVVGGMRVTITFHLIILHQMY
jgi:hypothetical protein